MRFISDFRVCRVSSFSFCSQSTVWEVRFSTVDIL
nr:MAG TPA: hypothetical protein [Herelleviridae sp.]